MDSARWERAQSIFHRAAELTEGERRAFVDAECAGDAELASEVLALLAEDARSGTMVDSDVAQVAHDILRPDESSPDSFQGREFGAWRVTGLLGEGGMGVVYLAERSDLGSRAAVKILRDAWVSPARRDRFTAERRTLAQLNHPSIAHLYDSGALPDGTPWFVMEHVEGVPITRYCRERSCTLEERLELFVEVCKAVQHAHALLIVHRDLKPSNILVRNDSSVKLLDFGISKQLESLDDLAEQTRTSVRLMTPAYAAPEQMRGERVGMQADVYSLGVVLYELLVGRLPFDLSGRSMIEAEKIILEKEPEKPSLAAGRMKFVSGDASHVASVSRGAWSDLDVLCLTAMHKDPARRYQSVEALMRDVEHFLSKEPLEARPDSTSYRLGKFASRHRRSLAGVAAVLAAVVLLTAFYTMNVTTARNTALSEAARAERLQQFTLNLLQGGDEAAGPADSLRVITLLDRGVQEAGTFTQEPATQARLYETLGSIYQKLGRFAPADSLLRAALAQRQRIYGPDNADVGESLVSLGMLYDEQAQYDSAEALVTRGLAMLQRHKPADHPAVAKANFSLGRVVQNKGDYHRAIAVLEEAVRLRSMREGDSPEMSLALSELANTHFYAGNFAVSDTLNRRALAMDRRMYAPNHPHIADALINLGAIQFEFSDFAAAERYYREALDIKRPWYGTDHPATAANLTMLGRALVSQKKLDDGVPILQEAVTIYERVYGGVHPRVASALNELGRAAQQQGRLDEAEGNFRRMADIYRTVYNDKHYLMGVALSNLAGVHYDRKQYGEAERLFNDVLRRYGETLAPGHQLVGIAKVRLGQTLLAARKFNASERMLDSGYTILMSQAKPPTVWVDRAREYLASTYDSLGRKNDADKFRVQVARK